MSFIRVYDRYMQPLAEIDEFSSIVYTKRFFDIGEWELHMPYRTDLQDILNNGMYYLVNNDAKKVCILENVTLEDEVVLSGYTFDGMFSRKIVIPPDGDNYLRVDNTSIEGIMYQMVRSQCVAPVDTRRKFNALTLATNQNRGIVTNWRATYSQYISEVLMDIGIYGDMGFDLYLDIPNKKWVFEVMQGRDLTQAQNKNPPVIFSTDLDSLDQVTYIRDYINYKNAVYAFMGNLDDNDFNVYLSRDAGLSDFELREVFRDASSEAEDTIELQKAAEKYKKESVIVETLNGDIVDTESFIYQQDWDLGDLVTVVHGNAGKLMHERITEVTEVYENNLRKLSVVFGIDKGDPVKRINDIERRIR